MALGRGYSQAPVEGIEPTTSSTQPMSTTRTGSWIHTQQLAGSHSRHFLGNFSVFYWLLNLEAEKLLFDINLNDLTNLWRILKGLRHVRGKLFYVYVELPWHSHKNLNQYLIGSPTVTEYYSLKLFFYLKTNC